MFFGAYISKMAEDLVVRIKDKLYDIRGERVMLDSDLAEYYGVETRALNQLVKRNIERFPSDFMFQLTNTEVDVLISQSVISKKGPGSGRGGRRHNPYVFTEYGAWTLSYVLRSELAVQKGQQLVKILKQLRDYVVGQKAELPAPIQQAVQGTGSPVTIYTYNITAHQVTVQNQAGNNNMMVSNVSIGSIVWELVDARAAHAGNKEALAIISKLVEILPNAKKEDSKTVWDLVGKIPAAVEAGTALAKIGEKIYSNWPAIESMMKSVVG